MAEKKKTQLFNVICTKITITATKHNSYSNFKESSDSYTGKILKNHFPENEAEADKGESQEKLGVKRWNTIGCVEKRTMGEGEVEAGLDAAARLSCKVFPLTW